MARPALSDGPEACGAGRSGLRSLAHELPAAAPGVALWWCDLARAIPRAADLACLLSPAEHARALRFGTEPLRVRWIAGRAALRLVLGHTLGLAPEALAIARGVRGRPVLADGASGVDFNVSNTRGVAIIAVARALPPGMRVGVDIEHRDRDVGADRLARKFLTPRERSALAAFSPDERRQRFLRHWTCKEAMSKATGDGLAAPFRRLDVLFADAPRLLDGPPPYVPERWSLHQADVPAEWLATVALWAGPA